ncbi:MAG: hypothetical protein ACLTXO_03495 [Fusobacterium varium]|jgi:hypothetical protein|uniref:hypothetical protein n=1 Tax=Fusobacterium varium TaxID=856 RepID=UPI0032C1EC92
MEEKKLVLLTITTSGTPCLWEKGGTDPNGYASAALIANSRGNKKKAIYFKNWYSDEHALIPVEIGDFVCDFIPEIYGNDPILWKIEDINIQEQYASLIKIDKSAAPYLIKMTEKKAMHYKCTIPYFVENWDPKTQYKIDKLKRERRG